MRIQIQDFDEQILGKNLQVKKINIFLMKIAIYLSLCLHKGRPNYRRSLQPSKENIKHMKLLKLFFTFVGHFAHLDLDLDTDQAHQNQCGTGSETLV
jgi:hypothetical protein